MNEVKASARVRVTVLVPVASCWGPECTVKQVHEQAADYARGKVEEALRGTGVQVERTESVAVLVPESRP